MSNKILITIRATNGTPWETSDFQLNQKVQVVVKRAVRHFVEAGVMSAGDYSLALVVEGRAIELADDASLEKAGVVPGATLALMARGPQVDG
ncbi:MAG: hypothetical protein M3N53_13095 [Actinomycetota bacterium]|nr:hypothetical protein [Actinomycetota bacterium]